MPSTYAASPIPIITLEDTLECAEQLFRAAQTLGFIYVTLDGTNITPSQVYQMFEISQKFFSSPETEKAAYTIDVSNRGWSSLHSETLDPAHQSRGDFKQAFNIGEFHPSTHVAQQPLPVTLSTHSATLSAFTAACRALSIRLLQLFATALKIPASSGGPHYFTPAHTPTNGPSGSILRLLYYPPPPESYNPSAGDIRAGAHSDYGSLTLLFQHAGQTGLEILSPEGGWSAVPFVSNAVCVNIGDLLSYWTAGLLRSTVHRVVVPSNAIASRERYSMVYFCHPVDTTPLTPIPSDIVAARSGRGANDTEGEVITAKEHLKGRLAATYGWNN